MYRPFLSNRLLLRLATAGDIPFLEEAANLPGFVDFLEWDPPKDRAGYVTMIRKEFERTAQGKALPLVLIDRQTNDFLGRIFLKRREGGRWYLGYWILPRHQRKGYATEAIEMVLDFAFTEMELPSVHAIVRLDNMPSQELLRKCDFEQIGTQLGMIGKDAGALTMLFKRDAPDEPKIFRTPLFFKHELLHQE